MIPTNTFVKIKKKVILANSVQWYCTESYLVASSGISQRARSTLCYSACLLNKLRGKEAPACACFQTRLCASIDTQHTGKPCSLASPHEFDWQQGMLMALLPSVSPVRLGSEGSSAAAETVLEWWQKSGKCLGMRANEVIAESVLSVCSQHRDQAVNDSSRPPLIIGSRWNWLHNHVTTVIAKRSGQMIAQRASCQRQLSVFTNVGSQ